MLKSLREKNPKIPPNKILILYKKSLKTSLFEKLLTTFLMVLLYYQTKKKMEASYPEAYLEIFCRGSWFFCIDRKI